MPIQIIFKWEHGSRNDNGIKLLHERLIGYQYFNEQLYARYGEWYVPVTYKKKNDNPNDNTWIMEIHIEAVTADIFPRYIKYEGRKAIKA